MSVVLKIEVRREVQKKIMQRLADALLIASEGGESEAEIQAMRDQVIRVGRLFGYVSWPGIYTAKKQNRS